MSTKKFLSICILIFPTLILHKGEKREKKHTISRYKLYLLLPLFFYVSKVQQQYSLCFSKLVFLNNILQYAGRNMTIILVAKKNLFFILGCKEKKKIRSCKNKSQNINLYKIILLKSLNGRLVIEYCRGKVDFSLLK